MSKEAEEFLKEYMNYTDRDLEYRPKIGYWKVLEAMKAYADEQERENLATIAYLRKEMDIIINIS